MRAFGIILQRNLIRLLLVFLVVAFVTWLLLWNARRHDEGYMIDCAARQPDGSWMMAPCHWE